MGVADVFPVSPDFGIERELDSDVIITPIQGQLERRKLRSAIQLRTFDIDMENMSVADHKLLNAFYIARDGMFDSFSLLPPVNHDRLIEGLSVGTGDGSTVVFDLDNVGDFRRVYLVSGSRNVVYLDGVSESGKCSNNAGAKCT